MPEVRLIDANKLERWLKTSMANENPLHCDIKETYSECITMVHCMETIDAVPVVRCRECWRRGKPNYCPMCQLGVYGAVPPYDKDVDLTEDDGFCHLGAKMDAND